MFTQTKGGDLTICLEDLAFSLSNTVDPSCMDLMASTEETLPSRDGVGSDDGAF